MASKEETTLRKALTEQYQYVERIGLNELSSGNLSCRFGDGMLISPSGATSDTISPDTIVQVTLDGAWEGDHRPSSEWRMHAAIYQAQRPLKRSSIPTLTIVLHWLVSLNRYLAFTTLSAHSAAVTCPVYPTPPSGPNPWVTMRQAHSRTERPVYSAITA
jgi:hypothetical protein